MLKKIGITNKMEKGLAKGTGLFFLAVFAVSLITGSEVDWISWLMGLATATSLYALVRHE